MILIACCLLTHCLCLDSDFAKTLLDLLLGTDGFPGPGPRAEIRYRFLSNPFCTSATSANPCTDPFFCSPRACLTLGTVAVSISWFLTPGLFLTTSIGSSLLSPTPYILCSIYCINKLLLFYSYPSVCSASWVRLPSLSVIAQTGQHGPSRDGSFKGGSF